VLPLSLRLSQSLCLCLFVSLSLSFFRGPGGGPGGARSGEEEGEGGGRGGGRPGGPEGRFFFIYWEVGPDGVSGGPESGTGPSLSRLGLVPQSPGGSVPLRQHNIADPAYDMAAAGPKKGTKKAQHAYVP
jgi:hypothetical protein